MKHPQRPHRKQPASGPSLLERITPNAAGVDCGADAHDVAVPADRDAAPVRSFTTFTTDLHRLADWLTACGVTTVAMESTGVYWIPLYEILEARGLDVVLFRPRFRGHRVDGNRLGRRLTGILGDTEIAAPLLKIEPGASTALALAAGPPDRPHATRSRRRARTCAGV